MNTHQLTLKKKEEIADHTMAFWYEKPAGFEFTAGQFCTLINDSQTNDDGKGNRRSMSICSSPTESDLLFAMRTGTSAYKQGMAAAKPGNRHSIMGPFGKFTLPADPAQPVVFIAGGIGITPFRSMLKFALDTKRPTPLTLLYSNYCCKSCAFYKELNEWLEGHPTYRLVCTMTGPTDVEPDWSGARGVIDEAMLREHVGDLVAPIYMIVGPTAMVDAIVHLLQSLHIPQPQIVTEKFTGL